MDFVSSLLHLHDVSSGRLSILPPGVPRHFGTAMLYGAVLKGMLGGSELRRNVEDKMKVGRLLAGGRWLRLQGEKLRVTFDDEDIPVPNNGRPLVELFLACVDHDPLFRGRLDPFAIDGVRRITSPGGRGATAYWIPVMEPPRLPGEADPWKRFVDAGEEIGRRAATSEINSEAAYEAMQRAVLEQTLAPYAGLD